MAKGVLEKAMDFLALRPLSTSELRNKLSVSSRYTPEEIEEALETCRSRQAPVACQRKRQKEKEGKTLPLPDLTGFLP